MVRRRALTIRKRHCTLWQKLDEGWGIRIDKECWLDQIPCTEILRKAVQNWVGSGDKRFSGLDWWKIGNPKEWACEMQWLGSLTNGKVACNGRDWKKKKKNKFDFKKKKKRKNNDIKIKKKKKKKKKNRK